MRKWLTVLLIGLSLGLGWGSETSPPIANDAAGTSKPTIVIIPIRDDIDTPMVFRVRRGVKAALQNKADLILLDMDTNGGLVSSTEEIIQILAEFPRQTATFVNRKAFSAGAFISVATQQIYMAPQSVIGAAAPVVMVPGGGVQDVPGTMEIKLKSALSGLVRAQAEKNGHNVEVVQAMIDKSTELIIDGEVLNKEGSILTLTDQQAAKEYGNPPKPLLSAGTVGTLDQVLEKLGMAEAKRITIEATGAEQVGAWLIRLAPLLLVIGVAGIYIEIKTPGFGLPGIVGMVAFGLYFLGGYAAGLSGWEWVIIFFLGLLLVILELFVLPGTVFIGLIGAGLMFAAIVMALVDLYPNPGPGLPTLPNFEVSPFTLPLRTIVIGLVGSAAAVWIASLVLPKTPMYHTLVSSSVSGGQTDAAQEERKRQQLGQVGVTASPLRPGGKVRFGEELVDVIAQGEFIPLNTPVRVIDFNGNDPIVERV